MAQRKQQRSKRETDVNASNVAWTTNWGAAVDGADAGLLEELEHTPSYSGKLATSRCL